MGQILHRYHRPSPIEEERKKERMKEGEASLVAHRNLFGRTKHQRTGPCRIVFRCQKATAAPKSHSLDRSLAPWKYTTSSRASIIAMCSSPNVCFPDEFRRPRAPCHHFAIFEQRGSALLPDFNFPDNRKNKMTASIFRQISIYSRHTPPKSPSYPT